MPESNSDTDLVQAARHDLTAFEELYLQYADQVFRYALERTKSPTVADDVLSETTAFLLENLDRFDASRGSFRAWLFTIVRRRISDHQRYSRRLRRFVRRRGVQLTSQALEGPEAAALRKHEEDQVNSALERLRPADRDLVLLRYAGQLTSKEIGELTGRSEGAVRVQLHRIRRKLAGELEMSDDRR